MLGLALQFDLLLSSHICAGYDNIFQVILGTLRAFSLYRNVRIAAKVVVYLDALRVPHALRISHAVLPGLNFTALASD